MFFIHGLFFFFKQKTANEMRISDWSSDVCSSDLELSSDDPPDLGSKGSDLAHGGIRCADLADQSAGLRGVGKGDALADAPAQHRRIVIGQRVDGLAHDRRMRTAAVHDEACQEPPATIGTRLVDEGERKSTSLKSSH